MGKPTDLRNKYKMELTLKNEETGVEIKQEYSIAGMTPMSTGGLTIDHIDKDGMLESNIWPAGSWARMKLISDPPAPAIHNRRKADQDALKAAMLAAKKQADADAEALKKKNAMANKKVPAPMVPETQ